MKYFTSDRHIGHKNILKYDSRPFATIEEHDKKIIEVACNINDDDELYFLGDLFLCNKTYAFELLSQIRCKVFSIRGNHDSEDSLKIMEKLGWTHLGNLYENDEFIISHYPLEERPRMDIKKHFHGHCHHNNIRRDVAPGHIRIKEMQNRFDCTLDFVYLDKFLTLNS